MLAGNEFSLLFAALHPRPLPQYPQALISLPGAPSRKPLLIVKHLRHSLLRQFHTQERRRISRHRPSHRRSNTREESLEATTTIQLPRHTTNAHIPRTRLQLALDRVDGKHGDPHRDTRRTARGHDGRQTEVTSGLAVGVFGAQVALRGLVRREVENGARTVAGQRHGGSAEDRPQAAFLVQLAHDVDAAGVLWLLARRELFLALDLQEDFDALEGRRDQRHGDRGEEACCADLGGAELVVLDCGEGSDERFAHVVAPETDGDWGLLVAWSLCIIAV